MYFIASPSAGNFKLIGKSHLKFDLDSFVPEHLPQPTASIYGDVNVASNTLLAGPDFERPLSTHTISYERDKDGPCGTGLLTGSYRRMLGADI
jgi:hypothetical protein